MSGVYIKGIEVPTPGEYRCVVRRWPEETTIMLYGIEEYSGVIIPVPDHGRLIEANRVGLTDFEIILCQADENPYKSGLKMLLDKIEKMPTIIPADKEADNG